MRRPTVGERWGVWLFRRRSYFPPLLLVVLILALMDGSSTRTGPGLDRRFLALGLVPTTLGFAIRAFVVGTAPTGTSGRSTIEQVAAELNTTGLYSVVRHPLYLGNLLLWLGLATTTAVWWTLPVVAIAFCLLYLPIVAAEERFLRDRFGGVFVQWATETPAFWPAVGRWRRPGLPFSARIVLRQEYYGLFTVVLFVVILELAANVTGGGGWRVGPGWVWLLGATTVAAGVLRWLQRRTSVLDVAGR